MSELLLEITVESLDTALAAERGGADRIELCAELIHGGLTPSVDAMRTLHEELEIAVFPIIRPRAGNFVYTDKEFVAMKRDISVVRDLGMDGVVFGLLRADGSIDIERTTELVEWSRPLEVTFHRAFDATPDLLQALEDVIATSAARILTAGGAATVPAGAETLRELVRLSGDRVAIMPGGGLDATNIGKMAQQTCAREFHSGLGSVLPYDSTNLQRFEAEIHAMKRALRKCASQG
ncbi:MAG: copper homeostasis protein CutC [Candidatus Acidiferrum sp.]